MSAPGVIDSLEFARGAQQLSGTLPVAALARLEDVLFDREGTLRYDLKGARDDRNRPLLVLNVAGAMHLQCQRCLGRLEFPLELTNALLVLAPGAEPPEELEDPEAPDVIDAHAEFDVAALIEDEVLLSLPFSPRHPEGACAARAAGAGGETARESAFSKLAALKQPDDQH